MAIVIVTANSKNSRPMTPPMNSSGMNTATSDTEIDSTVKAISLAPVHGGSARSFAILDMADDVFEHDDGIIDDEARRQRQRQQRQVVEVEAEEIHAGKGADRGQRQHDGRNDGGAPSPSTR